MLKPILALVLTAASAHALRHAAPQDYSTAKMTRARALRGLRGCAKHPRDADCSDLSSDFLINRYFRGRDDAEVLKVLLDTQPYGDGALSEGLGVFYAEMLEKRPRVFLRAIAGRPARERRTLCDTAGVADGGGLSDRSLRAVRVNLNRVAHGRDARLARVARACWDATSKANSRAWSERP